MTTIFMSEILQWQEFLGRVYIDNAPNHAGNMAKGSKGDRVEI